MSGAAPEAAAAAAALREQGNAQFKAGGYLRAAALYTQALKHDPGSAALHSNRSAALLHLSKVTRALADAEAAIALQPEWDKGYFRKGSALERLKRYDEALAAFKVAAERGAGGGEVAAKIRSLSWLARDRRPGEVSSLAGSGKAEGHVDISQVQPGGAASDNAVRARQFGNDVMAEAMSKASEAGGALDPSVHFLPGAPGAPAITVLIRQAFASPETLGTCVDFLRQQGDEAGALAAVLVVMRADIAFPQVWRERGAAAWPFGVGSGIFVQLEARGELRRQVWFVPASELPRSEGDRLALGPPEELDAEIFALM
eukprot:SM000172S03050  [mRNA]  locus=s172:34492:36672:+ [translate_table: standard]